MKPDMPVYVDCSIVSIRQNARSNRSICDKVILFCTHMPIALLNNSKTNHDNNINNDDSNRPCVCLT